MDDFLSFTPVPAVASPCVGICRIGADDVCTGCSRTLDEIVEWSMASDERRRAILERIAER
ncbi:putative Fe-S protein YdhL (DUF1289 family) [Sphingomonas sp. BE123]|uniref:DUF1289 domain-containing protein n=1 Tax=Sphingomonas sp. BE123 TaxID=2817842 RepID=UPI00285BE1B7|nr:DUF1289 domain-containing protein [Sphingomonas sp. BE123]MDR6852088.1 putative Fe-S protein YdhL (DUF1289 family) [Sphingomonas sp. BE123]